MLDPDGLRAQRDHILRIARQYGVSRVRLFGSRARGDARHSSDADLLIDLEPGRSLIDLVGFQQDVEALLGCHVDVVVEGGISPYLEERILREATPL